MQLEEKEIYPAIVVVAFNRPHALVRLLTSLEKGKYEYNNISLIISIDGGGNSEVEKVAKNFKWLHGEKEIILHEKNLGLREHVLKCGDLTEKYDSIIMLEEDCFVSPSFYSYACQALRFFSDDENIAGISLYSYSFNENARLVFCPLHDGYDIYFMQIPSSSGQAWTANQWKQFKNYYSNKNEILKSDKLPEYVKLWKETSWKKHFYKYLNETNKYIAYPQVSLTANFGDEGVHYENKTKIWQVNLNMGKTEFKFIQFIQSKNKYDTYFEILPDCIRLNKDTIIDLFGTKQLGLFHGEHVYSIKDCLRPLNTFGFDLKPAVMNIIYKIPGVEINFGLKKDFVEVSQKKMNTLNRHSNEFIYDAGFRKGYSDGVKVGREESRNFIRKSRMFNLVKNKMASFGFLK